jgi:CBS domain-containing protein
MPVEWTHWAVERIMSAPVVTLDADCTLERARQRLAAHSLRHVPVVEGTAVVGIISARDTALASFLRIAADDCGDASAPSGPTTVREAMTTSPITIHRHETITRAAERMLEHRVSALPVLDQNGQLVGIVTQSDLLRRIAADGRPFGHH